ncbi:DedA family protein [Synechococcus sp. PCC 6312]|uniref:DedA family protein n=1 Tax=Synechococcus sp. (strain ATCC 27167 / PCC 6312) TaxID=195253 RepID=UPI00029F183A|nr:DedA family protein [Synechococcus sp. PCC 6312]AFY60194.1 putative membrane-associated protein [Synechococcus sp. PCC 6312]
MAEWIVSLIGQLGYVGIALLMCLENLFPPIPSELIMPLAGFAVSQGKMNLGLVIFAGVAGTILGALPWYYLGYRMKADRLRRLLDRYGKWLGISGKDIVKSQQWFQRHGNKAVLWGRLIPGVRTLISLPAGIAAMNLGQFVVFSLIGIVAWVTVLTYLGFSLGKEYHLVSDYMDTITTVVGIALLIGIMFFLGKRFLRRHQSHS